MKYQVQLYEIAREAPPGDRPRPIDRFELVAESHDAARAAVLAQLGGDGRTVRSLSFLEAGGMSVVVTDAPPAPSPAAVLRARRGA